MIDPLSPALAHAEELTEAMLLRKLRALRQEHGPDVADAAIEGGLRAISIYLGGGKAAFDVFTRAADAAIVPSLKPNAR